MTTDWNVQFNHNVHDITIERTGDGFYSVYVNGEFINGEAEFESDNLDESFDFADQYVAFIDAKESVICGLEEELEELYYELSSVETFAPTYVSEEFTNELIDDIYSDIQTINDNIDYLLNYTFDEFQEFNEGLDESEYNLVEYIHGSFSVV